MMSFMMLKIPLSDKLTVAQCIDPLVHPAVQISQRCCARRRREAGLLARSTKRKSDAIRLHHLSLPPMIVRQPAVVHDRPLRTRPIHLHLKQRHFPREDLRQAEAFLGRQVQIGHCQALAYQKRMGRPKSVFLHDIPLNSCPHPFTGSQIFCKSEDERFFWKDADGNSSRTICTLITSMLDVFITFKLAGPRKRMLLCPQLRCMAHR